MKNSIFEVILIAILFATFCIAQKNPWTSARPDGHAPISIMADHYHKKGEFMFSYRFMPMWMSGIFQGTNDIDNQTVYQHYNVVPQKMQAFMNMLGVMYAPINNLTLMLMVNYVSKSMDLRTKTGIEFTTKSNGFGDMSFTGIIKILNENRQSLQLNVGTSIPTGSIVKSDDTPMMTNAPLAYPMQIGSGTWDPFFAVVYLGQTNSFSWGFQPSYQVRIGENSKDYTLGNRFNIVGWGAVKASDYFSFSTSVGYYGIGSINGMNSELNPNMMPLFNTENSGKSQINIGIGSNFYMPSGSMKNFRAAVEIVLPMYQNVNGIQMKNEIMGTLGFQYSFGGH